MAKHYPIITCKLKLVKIGNKWNTMASYVQAHLCMAMNNKKKYYTTNEEHSYNEHYTSSLCTKT